jgi:hypothetical protein
MGAIFGELRSGGRGGGSRRVGLNLHRYGKCCALAGSKRWNPLVAVVSPHHDPTCLAAS